MWAYSGSLSHTPLVHVLSSGAFSFDLLFIVSGLVMFLPVAVSGGRFGSVRAYAVRPWQASPRAQGAARRMDSEPDAEPALARS